MEEASKMFSGQEGRLLSPKDNERHSSNNDDTSENEDGLDESIILFPTTDPLHGLSPVQLDPSVCVSRLSRFELSKGGDSGSDTNNDDSTHDGIVRRRSNRKKAIIHDDSDHTTPPRSPTRKIQTNVLDVSSILCISASELVKKRKRRAVKSGSESCDEARSDRRSRRRRASACVVSRSHSASSSIVTTRSNTPTGNSEMTLKDSDSDDDLLADIKTSQEQARSTAATYRGRRSREEKYHPVAAFVSPAGRDAGPSTSWDMNDTTESNLSMSPCVLSQRSRTKGRKNFKSKPNFVRDVL